MFYFENQVRTVRQGHVIRQLKKKKINDEQNYGALSNTLRVLSPISTRCDHNDEF